MSMKTLGSFYLIVFAGLYLSGCVAPVILGGGAAVGSVVGSEKGIFGSVSDSSISLSIKSKFIDFHPDISKNIIAEVQHQEVLLIGKVTKEEWMAEAERIAWSVEGVENVFNHLVVGEAQSVGEASRDALITSEIKTHFFCDGDVKSLNYTVQTLDGVVYIMGISQNEQEKERVTSYARSVKEVKKVVCYVHLKKQPRGGS